MKFFHRKVQPWEVVAQQTVDAVPVFTEEEQEDLKVVKINDSTMTGVYDFELKKATNFKDAVVFARHTLMEEAAEKGFNVFLTEGWKLTHLRRGKEERAEVQYWGRPARAEGSIPQAQVPPFLTMLDNQRLL